MNWIKWAVGFQMVVLILSLVQMLYTTRVVDFSWGAFLFMLSIVLSFAFVWGNL